MILINVFCFIGLWIVISLHTTVICTNTTIYMKIVWINVCTWFMILMINCWICWSEESSNTTCQIRACYNCWNSQWLDSRGSRWLQPPHVAGGCCILVTRKLTTGTNHRPFKLMTMALDSPWFTMIGYQPSMIPVTALQLGPSERFIARNVGYEHQRFPYFHLCWWLPARIHR